MRAICEMGKAEDMAEKVQKLRARILTLVPANSTTIHVKDREEARKAVEEMALLSTLLCGMLIQAEESVEKSNETAKQAETLVPKVSYANKVKKQHEIIIESKDNQMNAEQVKCHVMTCVNPVRDEIGVAGIYKMRNRAIKINCSEEADVEKIKKSLEGNSNVEVKCRARRKPCVKIYQVDSGDREEDVKHTIFVQNAHIRECVKTQEEFEEVVKLRRQINTRNKYKKIVVLEVTPEIRRAMMDRRLKYKFESSWVDDYLDLLQCYKCYNYGHKQAECKSEQFCGKCASKGHRFKECKSQRRECIVCRRHNEAAKGGRRLQTDHEARDGCCPMYLRKKEAQERLTDY